MNRICKDCVVAVDWIAYLALIVYGYVLFLTPKAHAAEILPAVSPPTDWTGVAVVALIGVAAVAITGYILYLKRPGMQFGEEQIERLAELLHAKQNPPAAAPTSPLTLDGITFTSEEDLAKYKAAKDVLAGFTGGKT